MSPARRPHVLLDISRLVTRFSRPVPNGIDRVDLSFAKHFLTRESEAHGALMLPGAPRLVEPAAAANVVAEIAHHWRENDADDGSRELAEIGAALRGARPARDARRAAQGSRRWRRLASSLQRIRRGGPLLGRAGILPALSLTQAAPHGSVYLNVSQFPVFHEPCFRWLQRRRDVRAVFVVHDLLPLELPELFPPAEAARHARRVDVLARYASGLIVTSAQTREALAEQFHRRGRRLPPVCCLPLPVDEAFQVRDGIDAEVPSVPYFVVVGTIEPRKNHLLLLHIWRELAERLGERCPKLVVVGVRGWENENVVDMLERCRAVQPHVVEAGQLPTPALRRLLLGARALLMPSVAEGFGLPAAEALALGVPVIAAGMPALDAREGVQELSPIDGAGWLQAIAARAVEAGVPRPCRGGAAHAGSWTWLCYFRNIETMLAGLDASTDRSR